MFAAIVLAQAVTILVGGHPLQTYPGPIERAGRVFVPMRSIFERLGATVVYASGDINATRGRTTVALRIGSTSANIDGRPMQVDVAPFIVGATTYVPLRFIAQSLGANVDYNNGTRVVAITMAGAPPYRPVQPPYNPAPPPPGPVIGLYSQQPAPNVYVNNTFAAISAQFTRAARPGTVRVWLDGNDITYRAGVHAGGFSYTPPAPLAFGAHRVRVAGVAADGTSFDRAWTFTVKNQAAPMHLTINQPSGNAVGTTFTIQGNTIANGRIAVTVGVPPASSGLVSMNRTAGQFGNFSLTITVPSRPGQQSIKVRIVATDPVTSQTKEQILQLSLK